MQLITYLEQLSPSILKKIIEEHSLKLNIKKPNEIVNFLNGFLTDPGKLPNIYRQMTKIEKEVLNYFIMQLPNQIFPYRLLDKFSGTVSRDDFEYGITKLRRKGIIFALRKSWGELAFNIPDNLYLIWHRFFLIKVLNKLQETEEGQIEEKKESSALLEDEIFTLLSYTDIEKIPITQKGTIHRQHISKISEELQISNDKLNYFPYKKRKDSFEYPDNVSFLLEIAYLLELIDDLDFLRTTNKADLWHMMTPNTQRGYLEFVIRSLFKSTDIIIQHLFMLLFHLQKNRWYDLNDILFKLAKEFNRPVNDQFIERIQNEILTPLNEFGWVELALNKEKHLLFQWKDVEEQPLLQIYVQPNFEVLLSNNFPYNLRFKIEQFSKLVKKDQMIKYLITKESLYKGLKNGNTIEEILDFLKKYSVIPVSENVEKTLIDWGKNYGKVSFLDVRIMKCKTETIAGEIKKHPVLKKWVIGEITPVHLIIKRENFVNLFETLSQLEYYPEKDIWFGENSETNSGTTDDKFEVLRNSEHYIENVFPVLTCR